MVAQVAEPNFIILYVRNAAASAAFYSDLLGRKAMQTSPMFAMFPLSSGVTLALWSRDDVKPVAFGAGDRSEISFPVRDAAAVDALHDDWSKQGFPIAQQPTDMAFGRTFVALDPDGHRLRVFAQP